MKPSKIVLGITAGDPSGIGPEVALKALQSVHADFTGVIIARSDHLHSYYRDLSSGLTVVRSAEELRSANPAKHYIFDVNTGVTLPPPGQGSVNTGGESLAYIDASIELWKGGIIDGIVTGPVSKGLIEASGTRFIGHTEYIAHMIDEHNPSMMMYSRDYRVLLVTTHLSLKEVPEKINSDVIFMTIKTGFKAMQLIDGGSVRIALAGLDPHCGDSGAIGSFDQEVTLPSVKRAQKEGIPVEGPFSADTIFMPAKWKSYSLIIAQYHDQGLIPFKMIAFENGVNVTLGLSLVRTSVDHGTAFDIAGRGAAGHGSMIEAIKLACTLIRKRGRAA